MNYSRSSFIDFTVCFIGQPPMPHGYYKVIGSWLPGAGGGWSPVFFGRLSLNLEQSARN